MMQGEIKFVLMFRLDQHLFGFNIEDTIRVIRAVEIKSFPTDNQLIQGVIIVEEEIIPVFNLRKKLMLPVRDLSPDDFIILFRLHNGKGAVVVDYVSGAEYVFRDENTGNLRDTDEMILFKSLSMQDENLMFIPEPSKFMHSSDYINLLSELKFFKEGNG
ncbi:MAG: CheW domain-containing protein [Ignavibacteriales bacterium]|nr:MAG: CheW domain-containing protein [Ignavibacteriales bacterium]